MRHGQGLNNRKIALASFLYITQSDDEGMAADGADATASAAGGRPP